MLYGEVYHEHVWRELGEFGGKGGRGGRGGYFGEFLWGNKNIFVGEDILRFFEIFSIKEDYFWWRYSEELGADGGREPLRRFEGIRWV